MQKQNKKGRTKGKFRTKTASNKDLASKLKAEELDNSVDLGKRPNDVSWYVPDAQILNDVGRIPYSFPVGYPFVRDGHLGGTQAPLYDDGVPGILVMPVVPTIGNAKVAGDSVNVAANGMYTFVRHLNSGSRNYDANDLMIYVMAVDALYYVVSWMTRIYATVTLYSQANRYLPKHLLEAQGVDYDDILANVAQFRAGLNMRMPRISSLLVPAVLPIFQRHSWLFQNYYIEGDSEKDQIYMYIPDAYYVFGYDSDQAGMLSAKRFQGTGLNSRLTMNDLFAVLDSMMNPIIDDEDFNIISGDIYKAYAGNVMKLGLLPDSMTLPLVHNEEVLLQFKNAKVKFVSHSGDHYYDNFFNIFQAGTNKDHLETKTPVTALQNYRTFSSTNTETRVSSSSTANDVLRLLADFNEWSKETLLTSPHADVTPAENMVNTRLTLAMNLDTDSDWSGFKVNNLYFGSEWPVSFRLYARHREKITGVTHMFSHTYERVMIASQLDANLNSVFRSQWPIISAFKYTPEIALILDEDEAGTIQAAGRSVFELDNYTLTSPEVVGRLHDTAIMGEYNIPRIALFPTR